MRPGGDTPLRAGHPPAGCECRQGLGQQAQSLRALAGVPRCLGEQEQTEWPRQPLPYGHESGQRLKRPAVSCQEHSGL